MNSMTFMDMDLKDSTQRSLRELGFTSPTEIQQKAIPKLLAEDVDFIGQAQTGTGKTATFSLPLLEKLDADNRNIQALILAPTRELANQICQEIEKLSKYQPVNTMAVYGGTSIDRQIKAFKKSKPQIVVGTPGRVKDLHQRRVLNFKDCGFAVLDEADEMLDMGFFEDVKEILDFLPIDKKIWMFSATMPKPILDLTKSYFLDPIKVSVKKKTLSNEDITQYCYFIKPSDRLEALCRVLDTLEDFYALIFCQTRIECKKVSDALNERGHSADALHGDLSQDQRDFTMKRLKKKQIKLLVCTDVAARGIDVDDLTHVINFGFPQDNESYVHRIGRTGRAGRKGEAVSLISPSDQRRLKVIQKLTKADIEVRELPKVDEIKEILLRKSSKKLVDKIEVIQGRDFTEKSFKAFKAQFQDLNPDLLLKSVYTMVCEDSLARYSKARNIDAKPRSANKNLGGQRRFFINLGKKDRMEVGKLINFIQVNSGIHGSNLGRIDIKDRFSFFEAPDEFVDSLLTINGIELKGRTISIEESHTPQKPRRERRRRRPQKREFAK